MGLLWPDKPPDKARHSLSQVIYELKRELGDGWIEIQGEILQATPALTADAVDFQSAVDGGDDPAALRLYGGGFLDGMNLTTSRGYEGWIDRTRSRLIREHRKAAARLVAARESEGDVVGALAVARAWVDGDPLDDEGQHQLIALLARSGRRSQALRQYDRYRALLERELEVEPLEQTRELIARIREDESPEPSRAVPIAEPAPSDVAEPAPSDIADESRADPAPSDVADEGRAEPETALDALIQFVDELSRRRVNRVAVAYLVAALATLEGADVLLTPLGVPSWVQTALSVAVLLGFPVVLAVAWVFDITPRGLEITPPIAGRGASTTTMLARRGLAALVAISVAGLAGIWIWQRTVGTPVLDVNRVMVFPLVAPEGNPSVQSSVGEDVATMIGHALDRTGPLRWIDGWALLQPAERNNIRELTNAEARALATARQCAYFVVGRVVAPRGSDSTTVFLDLWDAAGDSSLATAEEAGGIDETWQTGLRAVNELLPTIVAGEMPVDFGQEVLGREPAAVASFLLGEQAFRRARGEPALANYRTAVAADSTFGLAAIRGAQAAAWVHDREGMEALAERALGLRLDEADRLLAQGMLFYARGQADDATAAFDRAIALEPDNPAAWLQKGEVHVHLAPRTRQPDSVAASSFARALEIDPGGVHASFHPLIEALVARDFDAAGPLRDALLQASPEEAVLAEIAIVGRCARRGMTVDEWRDAVQEDGSRVLVAAAHFAAAGRDPRCAEGAFRGILLSDAPVSGANRRAAFLGLQAVLLNSGRTREALALLDAASHSLEAEQALIRDPAQAEAYPAPDTPSDTLLVTSTDLFGTPNPLDNVTPAYVLIQAAKGVDLGDRGVRVMRLMQDLLGREISTDLPSGLSENAQAFWAFALYRMGIFTVHQGDLEYADRIAGAMEAIAAATDFPMSRALPAALRGHLAAARGDSTLALELLSSLHTEGEQPNIMYGYTDPLPFERIVESRLWLARGTDAGARRAYDLASSLDGAPLGYTLFLAESLDLRIQAAEILGLTDRARELRVRRATLAHAAPEVVG